MDLLLSEELLLLGLDEESGKTGWTFDSSMLGGALLLDLLRAGGVREEDGTLHATADVPDHPLLRDARQVVADSGRLRALDDWHSRLPYTLRPVERAIARRLVDDGVLAERDDTVLGLFRTTRLPEADPGPERALRARLRGILVEGRDPDEHDTLLVTLLDAGTGQVDAVFADDDRETRALARERAGEIGTAVRENPVIEAGHDAAVAVATVVTVTVATCHAGGACSS